MAKLERALARTVCAAALLFGVFTIIGIHRFDRCPECALQSPEVSDLPDPSYREFFERASRYRVIEAPAVGKAEQTEHTTTEHQNDYDNEIADELTLRFKERKTAIHEICANEVSSAAKSIPINNWEFLINHRYKLMWCSIFKSASSSWFDYFLTIAHVDPHVRKNSNVEQARKTAYPRPSLDDLQFFLNEPSYVSFVIVREPFERILSSYRDKIINPKLKFYRAVRCRMAKQSKLSQECNPSYPQFVDFILGEYAAGNTLDEHWMPYTLFCSICQVNYTYVLKFDNLQEEQSYLVNHVPGLENYPLLHEHASQRNYSSLVYQHYSQLSRAQLDGLVNLYRDDFLISGHSWLKYYSFIQEEPPVIKPNSRTFR